MLITSIEMDTLLTLRVWRFERTPLGTSCLLYWITSLLPSPTYLFQSCNGFLLLFTFTMDRVRVSKRLDRTASTAWTTCANECHTKKIDLNIVYYTIFCPTNTPSPHVQTFTRQKEPFWTTTRSPLRPSCPLFAYRRARTHTHKYIHRQAQTHARTYARTYARTHKHTHTYTDNNSSLPVGHIRLGNLGSLKNSGICSNIMTAILVAV